MKQLIEAMIERLVEKETELTSIPAFIRDLATSIAANPSMDLEYLNSHLHLLGWGNFEVDDYTLQLIIASLEVDPAYKSAYWFGRTNYKIDLHKLADEKEKVSMRQITVTVSPRNDCKN